MSEGSVEVRRCRSCGGERLALVLDLGELPASDHFPPAGDPGPDPRWPLGLVMCENCSLVQLHHRSPAAEEPRAVESATMRRHAADVVGRVLAAAGTGPGATVREFSSAHGGSWLPDLLEAGLIESSPDDPASLVVDNHSIIHAEDVDQAFAERARAVAEDGWFAIEFHHALEQARQGQFDTVRHGHPVYFSLTAFAALSRRHGLEPVDAWPEDVYGGCLVVLCRRSERPARAEGTDEAASDRVARILEDERRWQVDVPSGFERLRASATTARDSLVAHLEEAAERGRRVLGYGAGSKSTTLLGAAGTQAGRLPAVADLSPNKQGRRLPGTDIPVISPGELVAEAPDEVLILTWDIAPEVMRQLREAGLDADYYVPMPELRRVT